jgi:hypothetical protein
MTAGPQKPPPPPGEKAVQGFRDALVDLLQKYDLEYRHASFDVVKFLGAEHGRQFREDFDALVLEYGDQFFVELIPEDVDWQLFIDQLREHHPQLVSGDGPDRWDPLALHYMRRWMDHLGHILGEIRRSCLVLDDALGRRELGSKYLDNLCRRLFQRMRELIRGRAEKTTPRAASTSETPASATSGADNETKVSPPLSESPAPANNTTIASPASMPDTTPALAEDLGLSGPELRPASKANAPHEPVEPRHRDRPRQQQLSRQRHEIADRVWKDRGYQNCEDWAEAKGRNEPRQDQAPPTSKTLDNWLSGRTPRPIYKTRKWIAGSLKVELSDLP